jgi:hypothetical protein
MGAISQTYSFVAGAIPSASNWNSNWTTVLALVNGEIDAANVSDASDGIVTKDGAQTISGAKVHTGTLTTGVDNVGVDVKFFGDTSGKSMLWDESADTLIVTGAQTISETLGVTGVATFTAASVHTGGITSGSNIVSDLDSTDDLGTTGVRWANLFVDDITLTTSLTAGGVITGTTVEATGDTSINDNAAMGYTATEGLILTGQGSTNDVTIKNDYDTTVMSIATGTTATTFAGTLASGALTVTGAILSNADDGGALGASGTGFSDLFLASGGVVNFNAGNILLTHSANAFTITGGNFAVGATPDGGGVIDARSDQDGITAMRSINDNGTTAAVGRLRAQANAGAINIDAHGGSYTTSGSRIQDSGLIEADSNMSAGLVLSAAAAAPIALWTNGTERMHINSSGNVGINTASPDGKFDVVESGTYGEVYLSDYSNTDAHDMRLVFQKSGGTEASPTAVASGELLGGLSFKGYHTSFQNAASILAYVDGTPGGTTDMPGRLVFNTSPDGSSTLVERLRIDSSGSLYINDTANANMTVGLTINQGTNDNEILALQESGINHGITDSAETDTFANVKKFIAAEGGVALRGFSAGTRTVLIEAQATTEDTVDTTSSTAAIELRAGLKSGTGIIDLGATGNMLSVATANGGTCRFLIKSNGAIHATNVTGGQLDGTALDNEFDVGLLRTMQRATHNDNGIIMSKWDKHVKENEDDLKRVGVLSSEGDFLNIQRMFSLQGGGIWQLYEQVMDLCEKLEDNVPSLRGKLLPEAV